MPRSPKKPCKYPGCPNLTEKQYCSDHERLMNRQYERYGRDPDVRKKYGRAWKRIRDKYVAHHPFCEECLKKGILIPTAEVHHKLPLAEGGTHDRDNLVALCKSCHAKIHGARGDYRDAKKQKVYKYE